MKPRRLIFDRIIITNFKSFDGEHKFSFRWSSFGLHFMRGRNDAEPELGSNGAGKTTIWDALCWCLYGKTPAGLKNPDIKPWTGDKETTVGLLLKIGKQRYRIKRTTYPSRLSINGKLASQEAIDALVGLDYELLTNTMLLGQASDLFFDLQPRAKMDLFSNALKLDRWDERSKAAGQRAADLERERAEAEGELSATESMLESSRERLAGAKELAEQWQADHSGRLDTIGRDLRKDRASLERQTQLRAEHMLVYDSAMTELKALTKPLAKAKEALTLAEVDLKAADKTLVTITPRIYELQEELEGLGKGDKCTMCGQSLKGTALVTHRKELAARIEELEAEFARGVPKKITKRWTKAFDEHETLDKQATAFKDKADKALGEANFFNASIAELQARTALAAKQLSEREVEENPHTAAVRSARKVVKDLKQEKADCEHDIKVLARSIARTRYWVKGFKDIRLFVLQELLEALEFTTNTMLEDTGLIGWKVSYVIERETQKGTKTTGLTVMIQSPTSKGMVKWESWSGGEGQRLRVVGALALAEVLMGYAGVTTNLEVLDEPTQHLSGVGVRDLCTFLAERAARLSRHVWLIDHAAIASAAFTGGALIIKGRTGSRIARLSAADA